MRITFVLPLFDMSGGNRVISIYAEGLRRRGHEVLAVAPRRRPVAPRKILRSLLKGEGWPGRNESSHFDDVEVPRLDLKHGAPVVDADLPDADLVVATWWETAEWVAALGPSKGTKVHFMQDYEVWGGPAERVDATCRHPMPKIVIAQWTYDLLRDRFGQTPLALIPNSVDRDRFHATPRDKQPAPTVGVTYTTFRNKGCDISLAAVELARRELPDLRLVSFGLKAPAKELPLPAGTEYFLKAPDRMLREIYGRCDAWLFGTRIEGFGLPLLEAMACRTPVIGTPGGAAPDLLKQGGGILVPHDDPAAMASAIVKLGHMSNDEWRRVSDEALRIAHNTTWDEATSRFEAALVAAHGGKSA